MRPATAAAAFLLALGPVALGGDGDAARLGVETAHEISWDELTSGTFDPAWTIPETRTDPDAAPDRQPVDLRRRIMDLAALRFPTPEGAEPDPRTASFADLVAACRALSGDAKARDAFLDGLKRSRKDIWNACGPDLEQLGRDEFLRAKKWDPTEDHDRDGILHVKPFRVDCEGKEPWTKIDASRACQQGAAVFFADLEAIKTAENDYAAYPSNVGADYDWIQAVGGSVVKGVDPRKRPFSALRIDFRCDLPFPYSSYDCDLRILNRVADDGLVRCDIASPSRDFYWMAGQDAYVPLATSKGEFAGVVIVRVFGFDLRSVPDGESDVRASLRSALGNLKRRAEPLFAAAGGKPRTLRDTLPEFVVTGVKPKR